MDTSVFRERLQNLISQQWFLEGFVAPDYSGLNLKNLVPQIAALFGVGTPYCSTLPSDCLAENEGVEKVMLVILDGLGYNRLLHHINSHNGTFAEIAEKGTLKPLTTVFPSTTSTALTSLFSGLSPAQHQIIGYHMFSKKYGLIYNTLDMKPVYGYSSRVELAKDYAHQIPLLAPLLEERGICVSAITRSHIAGSGLSQITHRDQTPTPYLLASDMWTHSAQALQKNSPMLSIVYYSGVDTLAHKYGPYSKEVTFELTTLEHNIADFVGGLSEEIKKETLLVFAADHGVVEVGKSVYLKDCPELMQHLQLPPVGDCRASYLFCKPNREQEFREAFERQSERFKLMLTDDLIGKGVFGEPLSRDLLKEKLGTFTALSSGGDVLDYPYFEEDRQSPQRGAHGGMTAEEMIIPLLSIRLSQL
ncbi:alkaline phosphatase family protein [Candidatus Bathyarchaeota archaeon]|nr:alkaline phosphatase family protein [Candidatus Bathyarchaeota archaeon]